MEFENHPSLLERGFADHDLSVEPTRSEESIVEGVRPIGRSDDDHVGVGIESVHLGEYLIERLFLFLVSACIATSSLLTDRVDLIDEDDARC